MEYLEKLTKGARLVGTDLYKAFSEYHNLKKELESLRSKNEKLEQEISLYKLPLASAKELIDLYEGWIKQMRIALENPLQKALGTDHIKADILKYEDAIKILKKRL